MAGIKVISGTRTCSVLTASTGPRCPALPRPLGYSPRPKTGPFVGQGSLSARSILLRRLHTVTRAQAASTDQVEATAHGSPVWERFSQAVSGEWEGITATFSADGSPQELPDNFVPQAFRDWEQKLYDWHTQSSSLADDSGMRHSLKRMMPTVGCEADAAAFVEEEVNSLQAAPEHSTEGKTILENGSYSIGPRVLAPDAQTARIEHCLVKEQGHRARVVHQLKRLGPEGHWTVLGIEVHFEQYEGDWNGGRDLAACGFGMPAFAEHARVAAAALQGDWSATDGAAYVTRSDMTFAAEALPDRLAAQNAEDVLRLPDGVWSLVDISGDDVLLQAGLLISDSLRVVGSRKYENGRLTQVLLGTESKLQ